MTEHMYLKIFVKDPQLKEKYRESCLKQRENVFSKHPDAGFDLFMPEQIMVQPKSNSFKLPLGVKCAAHVGLKPVSFYMYPRSSMGSKTSLRLSNSVGVIDSGYRGELMGIVDNISFETQRIAQHSRLFQLVAPNLMPIFVELVDSEEDLGKTVRGEGGFGSTGGFYECSSPRRASP